MKKNPSAGFTLIELLIVVAVIAILAAIALPNYSCAQVRAKVSRTKADIRTVVVALETYHSDKNAYPPDWDDLEPGEAREARRGDGARGIYRVEHAHEDLFYLSFHALQPLTTPVAHLSSLPSDSFSPNGSALSYASFTPSDSPFLPARSWLVSSMGPGLVVGQWRTFSLGSGDTNRRTFWQPARVGPIIYDATNGCISQGDILRTNNVAWYPRFHGLHQ